MAAKTKQSTVREIRRRTCRKFAPEEKVRIVLEGIRGEQSIADLCRREGIASNPVLPLEQGLPRVREEAARRRYGARGHER
jgi:hypothetical protein